MSKTLKELYESYPWLKYRAYDNLRKDLEELIQSKQNEVKNGS